MAVRWTGARGPRVPCLGLGSGGGVLAPRRWVGCRRGEGLEMQLSLAGSTTLCS